MSLSSQIFALSFLLCLWRAGKNSFRNRGVKTELTSFATIVRLLLYISSQEQTDKAQTPTNAQNAARGGSETSQQARVNV